MPLWADPQAGFRPGFVIVYGLLAAYVAAAALTPAARRCLTWRPGQ
jgi:hypothetical protein